MQVEDLENRVRQLDAELLVARDGKVVVENLEDKTNFANLISRQADLMANLEQEQKRANDLEQNLNESKQVVNTPRV